MRYLTFILLSSFALAMSLSLHGSEYAEKFSEAQALSAEGSYAKAEAIYSELLTFRLPPETKDQLTYLRANAAWRNLTATNQTDPKLIEDQRDVLGALAEKLMKQEPTNRPPLLWAEVQASLGDSYWLDADDRNWRQAWQHYQRALDWWAGSADLENARTHYLAIVFRASNPEGSWPRYYGYGYWGNRIPIEYLDNALDLAQTSVDKARAHYLIGLAYQQQGGAFASKQFEANMLAAISPVTPWYDNALYQYAQWQQQRGASHYDEHGNWITKPDYEEALKYYLQILMDFKEGESAYWRQAQNQVEQIRARELAVIVSSNFLPEAAVSFSLRSRNVDDITVEVFPVAVDEIQYPGSEPYDVNRRFWWERIDLSGREAIFVWRQEKPVEKYAQHRDDIRIEQGLDKGLYVIRATAGGETSLAWLAVTRATVVTKSDAEYLHAWVVDAESSEPLEDADTVVWYGKTRNGNTSLFTSASGVSDADGLLHFEIPNGFGNASWYLLAETEDGPVYASSSTNVYNGKYQEWRIYAFTDRPAYRPEDTVQWKFSARVQKSLSAYSVPAGETLNWRIIDPRGNEVAKGDAKLNDYGSTWGELALSKEMPLGMFRVEFKHAGKWIGTEELFRLEEYKLPEFKVSVSTEGPEGKPQTAFRLGDRVKVSVQADYYFGGAVANADVEVVVLQKPFYQYWRPVRPYSWFCGTQDFHRGYYGRGSEVMRKQLKTDDTGRATFTIETAGGGRQDLEYTVEARVVDESRREISGTGSIKVTRQPYFAYLSPVRQLYQPGDTASIEVKTLNANESPVSVTGRLRVTREQWQQIWRSPKGEEITGEEYRRRQRSTGLFSRKFNPTEWQLIRQGYDVEEIETLSITTDNEGSATFRFEIPQAGCYKLAWFSQSEDGYPIKADTAIWAADEATTNVGFQSGLKLIFDEDAFRAGQPAPVMVTTPAPGRYVWLTVETDGLLESRVIEVEGTTKLLTLNVTDAWIPNVFIGASMFQDYTYYQDSQEAFVPPIEQFLDVAITSNAELYQPRDTGTFTVQTKDHNGQPVAAQVALSIFDESVLYIQPMLSGDPREFFYGQKRGNSVQTYSSVYERPFFLPKPEEQHWSDQSELEEDGSYRSDPFAAGGEVRERKLGLAGASDEVSTKPFGSPAMLTAAPMREMAKSNLAQDASKAGEEPAVVVRNDFRATFFWKPNVMTGPDGAAQVEVNFPDSLTTWQAEARAFALPGKVGQASAQVKTQLPLIARLQIPRFLVVGDRVLLSGVINNNTDTEVLATVCLGQEGNALEIEKDAEQVTIPANGVVPVNFSARALQAGEPKLTLTAKGTQYADAMEKALPIFEHGIDKYLAQSGKFVGEELAVSLDMPEFRTEDATFEIYATPSLAATMLDALPYLAQYPYGCVEQTMSRFLPAVIVSKTLTNLGLSEEDVVERAFGGIEKREAGEGSDQLYELKPMIGAGLTRLYDIQHSDGGWGWWKGGDSDVFMSAYVVWGLTLCQQADTDVRSDVLERGRDFLQKRLVEAENQPDLAAWMLHALASRFEGDDNPAPTRFEAKAFAELWKNKDNLNAYSRALTTLSAVYLGFDEEAQTLARNLENGAIINNAPQASVIAGSNPRNAAELATARWGNDGIYYRWSEGGVEATAFVLKALLAVKADEALRDKALNWLLQNRRGAQWSNTRDTAITLLALNDYLKVSGELEQAIEYEILLNGEVVASENVPAGQGPLAPSRFDVPVEKLKEGSNTITFTRKSGEAPLYFSARANFFTLEDPITPAGNVVFVQRDFYRIRPVPTLLDGFSEEKTKIASGAEVQSGDRVEVVLVVQAKNDLEYLVFEDLKAAGFEAVELQSGEPVFARELRVQEDTEGNLQLPVENDKDRYVGRQRWVYQELRDRKIASFVDKLPEGYWEIRMTLRAETPGSFSALPVLGHAMYVPEIRANSAEFKVTVEDVN